MTDDSTRISAEGNVPSYGILDIETAQLPMANGDRVLPTVSGGILDDCSPGADPPPSNGRCGSGTAEFDSVVSRPTGLSTLAGVFCPVCISMFSALLFLRMGFAVGQLGFLGTVVELLMAYSIILLTVLSLCALSSNGAVEGGGVYYMISRTLGPEFGGSIGLLFFIANVFSCALYIAGFVEALTSFGIGQGFGGKFIHCVLVSVVILCLCLLGSSMFARTAVAALLVIVAAYASFVVTVFFKGHTEIPLPLDNKYAYQLPGNESDPTADPVYDFNRTLTAAYTSLSLSTFKSNFFSNYTFDYTTGKQTDFSSMFAIIFSGVTGLMAGANVSGELARPNISIPRGTLQAVFFTCISYILLAFLLSVSCSRQLLQGDYMIMVDVNLSSTMIMVGIFAATFFSSMSNMLGASRVLNRLAHDRLFGLLLQPAAVESKSGNPILSVFISWICVVCVFLLGSMNKIAKITSIFFLLSYSGVNLACLALELTSAPNFRPQFKIFSWHTCALGAVSTLLMMLVVDASMSAIAIVLLMGLIMCLHYSAPIGSWGSISQALIYHQVRKYLLILDSRKEHVKFWRPQILLLVNRPATVAPLMDFVNDLKKSGLYVIGHVQVGEMDPADPNAGLDPLHQVYPYWLSLTDYLRLKAFVELTLSQSVRHGVQQLIRLSGLGAMKPNTVVLGFHETSSSEPVLNETHLLKNLKYSKIGRTEVVEYFSAQDFVHPDLNVVNSRLDSLTFVQILHDTLNLHKNLVIARHFSRFDRDMMLKQGGKRFIDVWPSNLFRPEEGGVRWDNSSLFVLQLACILSMCRRWKSTKLRVFIWASSVNDMHHQEQQLRTLLEQLRINAQSILVPADHIFSQVDRSNGPPTSVNQFPSSFVRAVNEMIRRNSPDTAACFLNLPLPPPASGPDADQEAYLNSLRMLTDDLPPTLLVHGLSSVISTAL
ncbi:Solute carrier family 12 member 9 [Aphelenchoides fujianensis]|nr:Solute carrier family 12 member 9 [Aphelenchoides fujianensis]